MKGKFLLPAIFILVFALSRIPGLMPWNFSVAYAFMFCAGVYFPGASKWWLPLAVILPTDLALNIFHYHVAAFTPEMALNYAIYAMIIGLGKWIGPGAGFFKLISGGLLGAVVFYLITNTLSWVTDPYYAKTIAGWIQALTIGHREWHPTTWEFFRNTLMSTGLFTALFAGAAKIAAESPADKTAGAHDPEPEAEAEPEEAKT